MTISRGLGEAGSDWLWTSTNLSHSEPALNPMNARSFSFLVRGLSVLMPNWSIYALQSIHLLLVLPKTLSICDFGECFVNLFLLALIDIYQFDWIPKTLPFWNQIRD